MNDEKNHSLVNKWTKEPILEIPWKKCLLQFLFHNFPANVTCAFTVEQLQFIGAA